METHIIAGLSLTLLILLFVAWKGRHERRKNQETLVALQKQVSLFETNVRADIRIMYSPLQKQIGHLGNLVQALLQDNQIGDLQNVFAEILRQEINSLGNLARQADVLEEDIIRLGAVKRALDDNIRIPFRNSPPPDLPQNDPYWDKLSNWMRAEKQWKCEKCGISLEDRRSDLHVHHIFGRGFNSPQHLKVLCRECHAEEPGHEHMKAYPEYDAFLKWVKKQP